MNTGITLLHHVHPTVVVFGVGVVLRVGLLVVFVTAAVVCAVVTVGGGWVCVCVCGLGAEQDPQHNMYIRSYLLHVQSQQ